MKKQLTLCMIYNDEKILLGMKKRGFGEGRWNGFGGKVEEGEIIEDSAKREVNEEIGIIPEEINKIGILEFSFDSEPKILEVHVYKINRFTGEPTESEEMTPRWFKQAEIPFGNMWPDDQFWFPYMLKGKKFRGKFHFDKPSNFDYISKIIRQEIDETNDIF